MRYLRKPFDYASAGVYADPGQPWDGLARLATLTDGDLTNGATPDTPIPAERENAVRKIFSDAECVQVHAALKTWSSLTVPQIGSDIYYFVVGMQTTRSYGLVVDRHQEVMAIGYDGAASSKVRVAHCADGTASESNPPRLDTIPSFTGPEWAVPGGPGELIMINNSVQFAYTSDSTSTWALQSYSGPPILTAAHYSSALGYYIIGNAFSYRANTLAGLVAAPTVAALPTPAGGSFQNNKVEFADNGSVILVAGSTVAGAGTCNVYRSTNFGASWSTVLTVAGASTNINIVWSDYYSLFFCWADNGEMYSSSDGASWLLIRSDLTTANGFATGRDTLLAVGPAIVKPTSYASAYGGSFMSGVAYSLNAGTTWNYSYFQAGAVPLNTPGLRAVNGRVFASGLGKVYRSGILWAPDAEF